MVISREQFNVAYSKLPYILRQYIAEDELSELSESIGKKYNLHVDTTGALYRETTNMLLGLINPTQFVGELKSVGIPEASIGAIVDELNAKVFMPLREKMKNPPIEPEDDDIDTPDAPEQNPSVTPKAQYVPPIPAPPIQAQPTAQASVTSTVQYVEPPVPAAPIQATAPAPHITQIPVAPAPIVQPAPQPIAQPIVAPVIQPSAVIQPAPVTQPITQSVPVAQPTRTTVPPAPAYTIPTQPARPSVSEFSIPSAAVSAATTTFSMSPASFSSSIPKPVTPPANIVAPHARTMQEDMRMAQEHPDQAVPPVQPQPVITPTRPPAYAQAPVRPLASPSTPNAFASPASPTLSTPNFSMPAVAPTPKPAPRNENRDALHAVLKEYGVDPYREPAD